MFCLPAASAQANVCSFVGSLATGSFRISFKSFGPFIYGRKSDEVGSGTLLFRQHSHIKGLSRNLSQTRQLETGAVWRLKTLQPYPWHVIYNTYILSGNSQWEFVISL